MHRLLGLRFDKHAFRLLNIAQFFAVLNDNLFKFLTIYLLIDLQGKEASSDILFWVGVCFLFIDRVLPQPYIFKLLLCSLLIGQCAARRVNFFLVFCPSSQAQSQHHYNE